MTERYIGLSEETIFGTPVAATKYLDVADADPKSDFDFLDQEGVADRGGTRKTDIGFKTGSGGWNMYVEPENGMTRILAALLGTSASALVAGSAYDHSFSPFDETDADKPSLTVRKADGSGSEEEVFAGRMLQSLEIGFAAGQYLMARVETVGMPAEAALGTIGTPTFSDKKAFVARTGVLQIDAADADIREASVTISNNFEEDDGVIGEETYSRALKDTRLSVEGELSWQDFEAAERTKFHNGTPGTLLLQGVGALINAGPEKDEFELKLDNIEYRSLDWPMAGRDVRRMTTGFKALIDATSGFSIEARVRNEETTVV